MSQQDIHLKPSRDRKTPNPDDPLLPAADPKPREPAKNPPARNTETPETPRPKPETDGEPAETSDPIAPPPVTWSVAA